MSFDTLDIDRSIVHLDVDAFFVAVEKLRNSRLRDKPVIVGGMSERGLVLSVDYPLRKLGIHAGMPIRRAREIAPEAVVLFGDYEAYTQYAEHIRTIVAAAVPAYEFASLDEFYLDLTGFDRYFGCWQFASELLEKIQHETGLALSMGQANCKAVAKVATGDAKPANRLHIERGTERPYLAPKAINRLPGAGPETCQLLGAMGVRRIGTLQQMPVAALEDVLGQPGRLLWLKAQAADPTPVVPYSDRKSLSTEQTFDRDTIDVTGLRALVMAMAERLAFQLRAGQQLTARVTVKLKYANYDTETQSTRLHYTAQDTVLLPTALRLFDRLYQRRMRVRLLGVSFSHLVHGGVQLSLLEDVPEQVALQQATDRMRVRFGEKALFRAKALAAYGQETAQSRESRRKLNFCNFG